MASPLTKMRRWFYTEAFPHQEVVQMITGGKSEWYNEVAISGIGKDGNEYISRFHPLAALSQLRYHKEVVKLDIGPGGDRPIIREGEAPLFHLPKVRHNQNWVFDLDLPEEAAQECCLLRDGVCERCFGAVVVPTLTKIEDHLEAWMPTDHRPVVFFSGRRGLHIRFPVNPFISSLPESSRAFFLKGFEEVTGFTFDRGASVTVNHLIRCPFSLHNVTHRLVAPLARTDTLADHPDMLAWFSGHENEKEALGEMASRVAKQAQQVSGRLKIKPRVDR